MAACHGAIAQIAPHARVIDVTHDVPPGDVARGAAVLAQTVRYLPPAVHVAVVDPGVGTARRGIAIRTPGGLLVGPDNGLLPWAADALGGVEAVVELRNPALAGAGGVADVPRARRLRAGRRAARAAAPPLADGRPGGRPGDLVRLPDPVVDQRRRLAGGRGADGRPVRQRPARGAVAPTLAGRGMNLRSAGEPAVRGQTFADAPPGGLVVLVDSAGRVAVAANGSARPTWPCASRPGDVLRIETRTARI